MSLKNAKMPALKDKLEELGKVKVVKEVLEEEVKELEETIKKDKKGRIIRNKK